jgi:hypothetical protein
VPRTFKKFLVLLVPVLIVAHWYFGSEFFTKYLFPGFDRSACAENALVLWLHSLADSNPDLIKTYWPNDTIPVCSSNLPLTAVSYEGINVTIRPFSGTAPLDSSWVRLELDPEGRKNPFSYTYDIAGHCYATWRSFSNGPDTLKSELKIEHWGVGMVCRRYRWVAGTFTGIKPPAMTDGRNSSGI